MPFVKEEDGQEDEEEQEINSPTKNLPKQDSLKISMRIVRANSLPALGRAGVVLWITCSILDSWAWRRASAAPP
jgi:hypothetical protein